MKRNQLGFSLLELVIVVVLLLILGAISVPYLLRTIERYQLESSAKSVASALQRGRYQAIRGNQLATTVYREAPAPPVYGIDVSGNLNLDANEAVIPLWANVRMTNVGAPPLTSMGATYDCTPACPAQPAASPFLVTFSSRGTAMQQVIVGPPSYWIEASRVYVLFVRHVVSGEWAAVTVTPGGRTRVWVWNGAAWATI